MGTTLWVTQLEFTDCGRVFSLQAQAFLMKTVIRHFECTWGTRFIKVVSARGGSMGTSHLIGLSRLITTLNKRE